MLATDVCTTVHAHMCRTTLHKSLTRDSRATPDAWTTEPGKVLPVVCMFDIILVSVVNRNTVVSKRESNINIPHFSTVL